MSEILHEIDINASPEKVFMALTTDNGLMGWWTLDVEAEPREGSISTFGFYERSTVFRMRIEELVPERLVRWICIGDIDEWKDTTLIFELKATPEGATTVLFTHSGWKSVSDFFRQCNTTWGALMYRLKEYCEGRAPGPFFPG